MSRPPPVNDRRSVTTTCHSKPAYSSSGNRREAQTGALGRGGVWVPANSRLISRAPEARPSFRVCIFDETTPSCVSCGHSRRRNACRETANSIIQYKRETNVLLTVSIKEAPPLKHLLPGLYPIGQVAYFWCNKRTGKRDGSESLSILGLEQSEFKRAHRSLCAVRDPQFCENMLDVNFDSAHADRQAASNLAVRQPLGQQL